MIFTEETSEVSVMNSRTIQFYKHCLMDYNYYKNRIDELRLYLDLVRSDKDAMAYPKISLEEKSGKRDPYFTLYSSSKYQHLLAREERLTEEIRIFSGLVNITDQWLESIDYEIKEILTQVYIIGIPPRRVANSHYYSDEKSMYRAIRKCLKRR